MPAARAHSRLSIKAKRLIVLNQSRVRRCLVRRSRATIPLSFHMQISRTHTHSLTRPEDRCGTFHPSSPSNRNALIAERAHTTYGKHHPTASIYFIIKSFNQALFTYGILFLKHSLRSPIAARPPALSLPPDVHTKSNTIPPLPHNLSTKYVCSTDKLKLGIILCVSEWTLCAVLCACTADCTQNRDDAR